MYLGSELLQLLQLELVLLAQLLNLLGALLRGVEQADGLVCVGLCQLGGLLSLLGLGACLLERSLLQGRKALSV